MRGTRSIGFRFIEHRRGSFPVLSSGLILIKLGSCETLRYERFSNARREIDARDVLSLDF
jgi:hypothetical protein